MLERYIDYLQKKLQLYTTKTFGEARTVPWNWICSQVVQLMKQYPASLTEAIVLADITQLLQDDDRLKKFIFVQSNNQLGARVIDYFADQGIIPYVQVLQATIDLVSVSPHLIQVSDGSSIQKIHMYIHQRFRHAGTQLRSPFGPFRLFQQGRKIQFTGIKVQVLNKQASKRRLQILPTEYIVFHMDKKNPEDAAFLQHSFRYHIDTCHPDRQDFQRQCVIQKVISIHEAVDKNRIREQRIKLSNPLNNQTNPASESIDFVLWDSQIILSSLFNEGDILALYSPYIMEEADSFVLSYGSSTVIFLVDGEFVRNQHCISLFSPDRKPCRVTEGGETLQDLMYVDTQGTQSISQGAGVNASVYGRLESISRNFTKKTPWYNLFCDLYASLPKERTHSYRIRLSSLQLGGVLTPIDIEVSGKCATELLSNAVVGNGVFIEGLALVQKARLISTPNPRISEVIGIGADWDGLTNCSNKYDAARVTIINQLSCILRCALPFSTPISLDAAACPSGQVTNVVITNLHWSNGLNSCTKWVHTFCQGTVEFIADESLWNCTSCDIGWSGIGPGELKYANLMVEVDDGCTMEWVECKSSSLIERLLNLPCAVYDEFSLSMKQDYLKKVIGATYSCLLSSPASSSSVSYFQLDQVIPIGDQILPEVRRRVRSTMLK